jgi:phosphoserine phosphatase RsbU/P
VPARLKKTILILGTALLLLCVFLLDVVRKSIALEDGILILLRDIGVLAAFALFYIYLESIWKRDQSPVKKLGFAFVMSLTVVLTMAFLSILSASDFDSKSLTLIPQDFEAIILANFVGVITGTFTLLLLLILRDIALAKRKKGSVRNLVIAFAAMSAAALSTFPLKALESSILTSILFGVSILAVLFNTFRLSWIVYLTKREKWYCMVYGFLLFGIFIAFDLLFLSDSQLSRMLTYYSRQLHVMLALTSLGGTIYFGMTFLSTLFHLPTAEAYDRKSTEVASLHNLSRLVTQVFDFNELVDSVTKMTLEVCQAQSAWLEMVSPVQGTPKVNGGQKRTDLTTKKMEIAGLKNIPSDQAISIASGGEPSLRSLVLDEKKPVIVDDVQLDRRTKHLSGVKQRFQSIVIVPLVSHSGVIGILYATKDLAYGFDREDVDLLTSFADHATIAIENSRLIEKSLERERLVREMMVAQDIQRRLLPQSQPMLREIEFEALSTPAFEVGGDYYDYTLLDDHRLGIIVGDVSGKGVSASFYMAEMKGIFQSLSKIYREPKDFLTHAHAALAGTIDRRSFISVLYAVLDLRTGEMSVGRAGHCPLLLVSDGKASYIQPTGMGLGMGSPAFFASTMVQETVNLRNGDVAVFFTDGVTEARPEGGEEFGYERLMDAGKRSRSRSALEIRDDIILAVDRHMQHQPPEDDLTLVVLKWKKV